MFRFGKLEIILFVFFNLLVASPAFGQTACNDPSGFLKSFGQMTTGDVLVLGPDCQHVQDLGGGAVAGQIQSRALAQTLSLGALSSLITLGYSQGADGGGSYFQNVGSTPFTDVIFGGGYGGFTITNGGSGYTPGIYKGQPFGGSSSGVNCLGQITVGAGGNVTGVLIVVPCVNFQVNDILQAVLLPGGSGFRMTVTQTFGPVASFSDKVGVHFQYTVMPGARINTKQFGAKVDYNHGNEAAATNDLLALQSAMGYASLNAFGVSPGNFGAAGNEVISPAGISMFCDNPISSTTNVALIIPDGVWLHGPGGTEAGGLHYCTGTATGNGNVNPITLCDTVPATGQFGCKISDFQLIDEQTNGNNLTSVVWSNSGQQQTLGQNLLILSKSRGCIHYQEGIGGAANDIWDNIDCEFTSTSQTQNGFYLNSQSTQHHLTNVVVGCAGCASAIAILNLSGRLVGDGPFDIEAFGTGLNQNVSAGGNTSTYKNVQQNSISCSQAITLGASNVGGNIVLENIQTGCPLVVLNGQSGGSNYNSQIASQVICDPGCHLSGGGSGTVTSVGITNNYGVGVTGSPVTTSGNIGLGVQLTQQSFYLTADVAMNGTIFSMGPQVTGLGGAGTWFASGNVVLFDSVTDAFQCQLVDQSATTAHPNTTGVYAASEIVTLSTQTITTITLTGFVVNPSSIGIQCWGSAATSLIKANATGSANKDSHIDAMRIR